MLALHGLPQDNISATSAVSALRDAALIESRAADVFNAGKSALRLSAGVGAFDVYHVDGVHVANGNLDKKSYFKAGAGDFSGSL